MKIIDFNKESNKAIVELTRSEVGDINGLMFQAKETGPLRAHFFLLYDLLSHGAFDEFALDTAHKILMGNTEDMYAKEDTDGTA